MKRYAKLAVGWSFVVLGVAGLVLPILQGILFLAIGFSILATEMPWAERQLHRLRQRFPRAADSVDAARERAAAWVRRFGGKQQSCDYD